MGAQAPPGPRNGTHTLPVGDRKAGVSHSPAAPCLPASQGPSELPASVRVRRGPSGSAKDTPQAGAAARPADTPLWGGGGRASYYLPLADRGSLGGLFVLNQPGNKEMC